MKTTFKLVSLAQVRDSLDNPRHQLSNIEELAASIKTFGILQPLVVRPIDGNSYELIAGHRRAAAAELAGLAEVPCVIRNDAGDLSAAQLVENTQRVDLKPAEIAGGVLAAMKARKIKQRELAEQLGKSEAWVSKFVAIGKALALYPEHLDLNSDNSETAYNAAARILNPEKPRKNSPTTPPTDQQDDGDTNHDQDNQQNEQAEGQLQYINEVREKLAAKLGMLASRVELIPEGKQSWRVQLYFKTDHQLNEFAS